MPGCSSFAAPAEPLFESRDIKKTLGALSALCKVCHSKCQCRRIVDQFVSTFRKFFHSVAATATHFLAMCGAHSAVTDRSILSEAFRCYRVAAIVHILHLEEKGADRQEQCDTPNLVDCRRSFACRKYKPLFRTVTGGVSLVLISNFSLSLFSL